MKRVGLLLIAVGWLTACGGPRTGAIIFDIGRNIAFAELEGAEGALPQAKESSGLVRLVQKPGTSVSFYARIQPGCTLTFGHDTVSSESGGIPIYSVDIKVSEKDPPIQLYRESGFHRLMRRIGLADRTRIALPNITGAIRLTLRVESSPGKAATGVWLNPRIESPADQTATSSQGVRDSAILKDASFVIILLDAGRADHFGCYGYKRDTTPNIDRLASESAVFLDAECEAVFTQASVGSLLTSQYPDRHGSVRKSFGLSPKARTVAQVMKEGGWATALMTASPNASSLYGYNRGFDTVREIYKTTSDKHRLVSASEVVDDSIDWVRAQGSQKFFLYMHIREPHTPHTPPPPFYGKYAAAYDGPLKDITSTDNLFDLLNSGRLHASAEDRAYMSDRYDENLAYADSQVGRFLDEMRKSGRLENMVVVLVGDHGEGMGEHDFFGHNALAYREIQKVPLILRLPSAVAKKQAAVAELVGIIDIAPTLLACAGLTPPTGEFQGRDLLPAVLAGSALPRGPHFVRTAGVAPIFGVAEDGYKYLYSTKTARRELYQVRGDPAERENLTEDSLLRVSYMHQTYRIWARDQEQLASSKPPAEITASPEDVTALMELGYVDPNQGKGVGKSGDAPPEKPAVKPEKKQKKGKHEGAVKKNPPSGEESPGADASQRHRRHRRVQAGESPDPPR